MGNHPSEHPVLDDSVPDNSASHERAKELGWPSREGDDNGKGSVDQAFFNPATIYPLLLTLLSRVKAASPKDLTHLG